MSKTGYVDNDAITEASGLCRSISNPGLLYTHNDSGDSARVFAITDEGMQIGKLSQCFENIFVDYRHPNSLKPPLTSLE